MLVDYPLGSMSFRDGATIVLLTVPLDDALFVPGPLPGDDPEPLPDARFEGDLTLSVTGSSGWATFKIWRNANHNDGEEPWRGSDLTRPGGVTEASGPLVVKLVGRKRRLDDVTVELKAAGG